MSFAIKITLRASRDEEEAYNYYEDIQTGLGEEFWKKNCIKNILVCQPILNFIAMWTIKR